MKLRQAFDQHYHSDELSKGARRSIICAIRAWQRLTPDPTIDQIGNQTVEDFRRAALAELSPRTVNGYWTALRSVLRRVGPPHDRNPWGLGLIERVPAMRPCRVPFKRPRRLTMDELSLAYIAARKMRHPQRGVPDPGTWWQALLVTAYFTALRSGDLLGIEWGNVNWEDRTLFIRIAKTGVEADLPLHDIAIDHLRRLTRDTRQIFAIDRAHLYYLWLKLRKRAGVDFGFHDIRRTVSSEIDAIDRGLGKVLLLHAPGNVTERSYLNALNELRPAIERMAVPLAFKHGLKQTDRVERKFRQESLANVRPENYAPVIKPTPDMFAFQDGGFFFRGKFHRMRDDLVSMLRRLLDGPCSRRDLWATITDKPYDRKTAYSRVHLLRRSLRYILGIPSRFNPVCSTCRPERGSEGRYELFLPPGLWEDE